MRILLIQSDFFQQELYSLILEEAGFITNSVNSVSEAISLVNSDAKFDLILCDVILPDSTAIELLIMLSQLGIRLPAIFISSFRNSEEHIFSGDLGEELRNELKKMGFRGIIEKPSNSDDLLTEIHKIFNRQNACPK